METHDAALIRRIRRLEWCVAGSAALWALMAWGLWARAAGAAPPPVVRAAAVEVTDATGRVRAVLDAAGRRPALVLYDADGRRRLSLGLGVQGNPEVVLADARGRPRLLLRAGYERAAEVQLADGSGRPRAGLWITHQDEPGLWLFDELARPRIGLKVLAGGVPRLWLFEESTGRILFTAP
ncbi:MAG: hypothetical protein QN173_03510 [Armatimonadota bacterium]|nr:hypothetical protein [Armatimonadota bacterium]MDR7402078.1 hypothetical protein [Armatimonadota bacterium]MDR7437096.1 hypothetical protein [Armatimonadota bacterium]MDR7472441.1 hypothetical protein [Armatimonadota bacterium]MDR7506654.1 hypothetical protein [Armatimonadota bacterium]